MTCIWIKAPGTLVVTSVTALPDDGEEELITGKGAVYGERDKPQGADKGVRR